MRSLCISLCRYGCGNTQVDYLDHIGETNENFNLLNQYNRFVVGLYRWCLVDTGENTLTKPGVVSIVAAVYKNDAI